MNKYFSKSFPSYTALSYTEMLRFKKYDGVTLGGLCRFVVKIFTYIDSKEYSSLVFIDSNDTNCIVNNLKNPEVNYIVGEREGYYYLAVLPSSSNSQTLYTEIMYCENPNFIEPLNMMAFDKSTSDYTLVTVTNSYNVDNVNFNLDSSKFCKIGQITMYQSHRFVGNFTITSMDPSNLTYGNFIIQVFKNSSNEFTGKLSLINSSSDFIASNINVYYVIDKNNVELYVKNNSSSIMRLDINKNYTKTNSIYNFELVVSTNLSNIDTSNPLLS